MPRILGKLASGQKVRDREDGSHLHDTAAAFLKEAFAKIALLPGTEYFSQGIYLGPRKVGYTDCVATSDRDEILYAKRPNRLGHTRFVKNRNPEPTSYITIALLLEEEGDYTLLTAFLGEPAPPEPWDERATAESRPFWDTHALIWGAQEIVPGTEMSECPW